MQVMPSPLLDRVYQLLGPDLQEIGGTVVAGEIPISDAVINRVVGEALAGRNLPVTAVRIEAEDDGRLMANVSIRGPRLIPQIRIAAAIDRQPEMPQSPVLGLRWSLPGMGPLAMFASPFLSQLKSLPPGIRIEGDRILIDIAQVLRQQGLADVLRYVTGLQIGTRRGRVIVRFELRA
jgi:hypothetical protein